MSTAMSTRREPRQLTPFFRPFEAIRNEFDDMFGRWMSDWDGNNWAAGDFKTACDVSETADAFEIRMDVPGMKPEDITVQVTGDTVRVFGERKEEKQEKDDKEKTFHRFERRHGKFSETIVLPMTVKDDHVQAEFHEGVLTIALPKSEASKTRTVKVKANGKS